MEIRAYHPTDCEQIAQLFYETVHTINAKDYTQEQLDAWATGTVDMVLWNQSFLIHDTLVAVQDDKIIARAVHFPKLHGGSPFPELLCSIST